MNPALRNAIAAAALMLVAGIAALALRPTQHIAAPRDRVDLDTMIPKRFGKWTLDPNVIPLAASPDVQASLDALYSQMLLRSYSDPQGRLVMLLIAYGSDQRGDETQVHRPEFCYTSQGFQLVQNVAGDLATPYGTLPVRRLVAHQQRRHEPITYWITVGKHATLPGIGRKIHQIAYGLTGRIADGMLVRISSIDADTQHAYQTQDEFIRDMLAAIAPEHRQRLAGMSEATTMRRQHEAGGRSPDASAN